MARTSAAVAPVKLTAAQVIESLRLHFKQPEYALIEQVANATGIASRRWIDAVALSLWPSRGLEAHAIEVKVSRSDWCRERDDPAKGDEVGKMCHRFWVAAPAGVVPLGELPPAWGLIEVPGPGAAPKVVRLPDKREVGEPSWAFVCALLRRVGEAEAERAAAMVPRAELDARVETEVKREIPERLKIESRDMLRRAEWAESDRDALKRMIADFERLAGVNVGDAVLAGRAASAVINGIRNQVERLQRVAGDLALAVSTAKDPPPAS